MHPCGRHAFGALPRHDIKLLRETIPKKRNVGIYLRKDNFFKNKPVG
jgi:hypothetical protein